MRNSELRGRPKAPGHPGARRQTSHRDLRLFAGPDSHRVLPPAATLLERCHGTCQGFPLDLRLG